MRTTNERTRGEEREIMHVKTVKVEIDVLHIQYDYIDNNTEGKKFGKKK